MIFEKRLPQRLREDVESLLGPEERVLGVFVVVSTLWPRAALLLYGAHHLLPWDDRSYVVAVTDEGVVLFSSGFRLRPQQLLARYDGHGCLLDIETYSEATRVRPGSPARVTISHTTYRIPLGWQDEVRRLGRMHLSQQPPAE